MRARDAQIATLAQIAASYAWREATFNARSQGILCGALRRRLALPRRLERLVVGLPPDGELARCSFGWGARLANRAGATGRAVGAMHLIAHPLGVPLTTIARLEVRGRGHAYRRGRVLVPGAPAELFPSWDGTAVLLLEPNPPPRRQSGELLPPQGGLRSPPPFQELIALGPDLAGEPLALTGLLRHARVVGAETVARVPCRRRLLAHPGGSCRAQLVQRLLQGFQDPRQAVPRAEGRQACVASVRCVPRAFTHPRAWHVARKGSRNRWPTSWASMRQRKSCNQVKSKPGSVKSRLSAYCQSLPRRTAAAAWRSVSPAIDGLAMTSAKRQGATATGRPWDGYRSAQR
jgi:hypothetical protein